MSVKMSRKCFMDWVFIEMLGGVGRQLLFIGFLLKQNNIQS